MLNNNKLQFKNLDECLNISYASVRTYLNIHHNNNKRIKIEQTPLVPITFCELKTKRENNTYETYKALLDSGASSSLITENSVRHLKKVISTETSFGTVAGNFSTNKKCKVIFRLAEFNPTSELKYNLHVTKDLGTYDMLLGRDFLRTTGIDLKFSSGTMTWNDTEIDMKPTTCTKDTHFHVEEELFVTENADRISKMLDAKYKPADLNEITAGLQHLNDNQRSQLKELLNKRSSLLDGTLGLWKGTPYKIELRDGVKPFHAQPYLIPQAYEQTFKKEVERLCSVEVLKN